MHTYSSYISLGENYDKLRMSLCMYQINDQESQIKRAEGTITTMQGEMEHMRGKIEEALKLIDIAKKLEEKIVSVQHR